MLGAFLFPATSAGEGAEDGRIGLSSLDAARARPYPARVTSIARSFYFSGFFYYGFPLAGRDWRRTRE